MPFYSFLCDDCLFDFEANITIDEYDNLLSKIVCPNCLSRNVFRDYKSDNVSGGVVFKTLGAIADRNNERMSSDEKQALFLKHNDYRFQPKPELPEGMKRIDREKPFHDQPRRNKPKRQIKNT